MTNQDFISANWSITITVILCAIASYWCWVGAMKGLLAHRVPRVVLACGVSTITVGFTTSLFFDYFAAASISRIGLWVTAIGLSWSSISGIRAGRQMKDDALRLTRVEQVLTQLGHATGGTGGTGGAGGAGGAGSGGAPGQPGEPGKPGEPGHGG